MTRAAPSATSTRSSHRAEGWASRGPGLGGLNGAELDELIARPLRVFVERRENFEWKLHGHDRPHDPPDRLRAAGLLPEAVETVMIAPVKAVAGLPRSPVTWCCARWPSGRNLTAAASEALGGATATPVACRRVEAERAADPQALTIVEVEAGPEIICAG